MTSREGKTPLDKSDFALERRRILRAAADGRLRVNDSGRYIIEGEKRPDRRARESLMYGDPFMIHWPSSMTGGVCRLSVDGASELRELERMLG